MVAVAFFVDFVAVGFFFYSYGVFFKAIAAEFGGSRLGVSLGITITSAVGALAAPLIGHALDRYPLKRVIGAGTVFPLVTLVFGLTGFALAMYHDMRDPHRVTRHAACGFWLHLLAAPAIVNTAAFTLYSSGGTVATAGLIVFLLAMASVALVIDRRSFLLSGIGYVAVMLFGLGEGNFPLALIFLGILILGLGAGWVTLRATLMRALPGFPGKDRLPPYAASTEVAQ